MSVLSRVFPESASTVAGEVDALTLGLLVSCGLMAALIVALIIGFAIVYRKGSQHSRRLELRSELAIEWSWTIATLGVFMVLFVWGSVAYFKMHLAPAGAYEVTVIGKQWMWKFQHPDGRRELNALHVPIGKPVVLTMTSEDVIHSLFVPAFRIKQDVVPGRYTYTWFEANKVGTYRLFCTQYCGTMHAEMRGEVIVMPAAEFQSWLQSESGAAAAANPATRGGALFGRMGCTSCHGAGSTVRAPGLAGLYRAKVQLADGRTVVADDDYLRESILSPRAKVVRGFAPVMPSYSGLLSEEELFELIAYLKSVKRSEK